MTQGVKVQSCSTLNYTHVLISLCQGAHNTKHQLLAIHIDVVLHHPHQVLHHLLAGLTPRNCPEGVRIPGHIPTLAHESIKDSNSRTHFDLHLVSGPREWHVQMVPIDQKSFRWHLLHFNFASQALTRPAGSSSHSCLMSMVMWVASGNSPQMANSQQFTFNQPVCHSIQKSIFAWIIEQMNPLTNEWWSMNEQPLNNKSSSQSTNQPTIAFPPSIVNQQDSYEWLNSIQLCFAFNKFNKWQDSFQNARHASSALATRFATFAMFATTINKVNAPCHQDDIVHWCHCYTVVNWHVQVPTQ